MNFTEETANQIIEKYNLSPKTLRVWKTRGKIPARYLAPDYSNERISTSKAQVRKLQDAILLPEIRKEAFVTNDVGYQSILDCLYKDQQSIRLQTYNELRGQVVRLRGELRNYLGSENTERNIKNLKSYLHDSMYLHHFVIFKNAGVTSDRWGNRRFDNSHIIMQSNEYPQLVHYIQLLQSKLAV